jgi:hypothetical protein
VTKEKKNTVYQPISYSTESFIDVDFRYGADQAPTLEAGSSVEGGETMHQLLATTLNTTVQFLVRNQSKDGSWGAWQNHSSGDATRPTDATFVRSAPSMQTQLQFTPSGDAQRSPRVLSLLQWFDQRVAMGTDASVRKSIREYVAFVLNPINRPNYGIGAPGWLALPAGFVGLAAADLISPWCTFGPGLAVSI